MRGLWDLRAFGPAGLGEQAADDSLTGEVATRAIRGDSYAKCLGGLVAIRELVHPSIGILGTSRLRVLESEMPGRCCIPRQHRPGLHVFDQVSRDVTAREVSLAVKCSDSEGFPMPAQFVFDLKWRMP